MDVRYAPGTRFWAVSDTAVAVLDPTVTADVLDAVWTALAAGGGVGQVLQVMTGAYGSSLTSIPPFAVVAPGVGGVLLAVRGPIVVSVLDDHGVQAISGEGVTTWSERWVPDPLSLEIAAAGCDPSTQPDGRSQPIRSGVVTADGVRVILRGSTDDTPVPRRVAEPRAVEPEPTVVDHVSLRPELDEHAERADRAPVPTEPPMSAIPDVPTTRELTGPGESGIELTMVEGGEDSFDHLWGATVMRSVEDAAVRDSSEAEDGAPDERAPRRLIADVPTFDAQDVHGAGPDAGDHDGETIMGSQLAAMRSRAHAQAPAPVHAEASAIVPERVVLARVCRTGHPNPPQAALCRACGLALTEDATRVPKPTLGRIALSTGPVIALDRPVVVGRKPRVSRVQGADLPRLVTVPSPAQDISRSHLEIRIEEWHVLAVDLGTTNGTILIRPGQPQRRLHPNEAVMIRSDDVVDIGEGVLITFEEIP
jgi:hypothetical protein